MSALVKIDFHGDSIWAGREEDDVVLVAVKPMVEGFGLSWQAQLERIKRDELLAASIRVTRIETPAGMRESVALPLNLIPGFLFGISTERITDPEAKAKVLAYKAECYAVLYAHFFGTNETPSEFDWEDIAFRLGLVKEARLQHGRKVSSALWIKLGLPMPDDTPVQMPAGASAVGLDYVRQFLADRTAEAPGGRIGSTMLFEAFEAWAREAGNVPQMTHTAFGLTLNRLGVRKANHEGRKFYLGLRLKHRLEIDGEAT